MRHVLTAAAIAASAILASFALPAVGVRAEEPAASATQADAGFDHVIQRVLAKGTPSHVDNFTARIVGLNPRGAAAIDCVSMIFANDEDLSFQHRIDVVDGGNRVVMATINTKTQHRDYFLGNRAGHLQGAVQGTSTKDARVLSLSVEEPGFEAEKADWIKTLGAEN